MKSESKTMRPLLLVTDRKNLFHHPDPLPKIAHGDGWPRRVSLSDDELDYDRLVQTFFEASAILVW